MSRFTELFDKTKTRNETTALYLRLLDIVKPEERPELFEEYKRACKRTINSDIDKALRYGIV